MINYLKLKILDHLNQFKFDDCVWDEITKEDLYELIIW